MCKYIIIILLVLFPFVVQAGAVENGASVYIVPMENGLDKFIAAEIFKKKLPINITMVERKADYVLVGSSISKGNSSKWYDVVFGSAGRRDSVQASMTLIKRSNKTVVWAGNAGDRSAWWGLLKRGGERKVALRIVRAMKKDLF